MTIKKFEQEKVTERFSRLPESVQDIILSDETTSSLHKILNDKKIDKEKQKEFNEQITLTMIGLSVKNDLKEYMLSSLNLDENTVNTIYQKIDSEILSKIRDALLTELDKKKETNSATDPYREPSTNE